MVVGAKVCDLTENLLWFVRGLYVGILTFSLIIAAASEHEHDIILHKVLDQARDKGIRFNYKKIQFKVSLVEYTCNLVSSKGLKPDPKKVEAISDMPMPTGVPSVHWA